MRMHNKSGFTVLELIIVIGMTAILIGSIGFVYMSCFKAFNAGEDRSKIRTELSQALELMTRELTIANGITTCTSTSLVFTTANATITYSLNGTNLLRGGAVKATNIQGAGTTSLFACSESRVTIDLTSLLNGVSVHLKASVKPRNIPQGLVGWWKLDDGASGSTPTTAADSTGRGNTGTLTNGPIWTSGQISNALSFNGSNTYITAGTDSSLNQAVLSIIAWVKFTNTSDMIFVQKWQYSGDLGYTIEIYSGNILFAVGGGNGSYPTYSATTAGSGSWHLIAGVFDGTTQFLYVDGQLRGFVSSNRTTAQGSGDMRIGGRSSGGANTSWMNGSIDDVRIYNRALTQSEISQLYNTGIGN